jgi:general secretion pathway protein F
MPIFEYRAVDGDNKTRRGLIDADSAREARLKLRREQLYVTVLNEKQKRQASRLQIKGITGVDYPNKKRLDQVAAVTRQMSALLKAGIPLAETLRMVIEQAPDRRVEAVFRDIREKVTQGLTLADACQQHPAYFTNLYSNMIRAGESSGALDQVMTRLAAFMQAQSRLKNRVGSAMVYPMVMIVVGVVVVAALVTFVVPQVTQLLRAKGEALPLPTQILIALSDFLRNYWFLVIVGLLLLIILFQLFVNSDRGRLIWDRFLLRVPVFGELMRKQAVARFATTFATLLKSGVPALQAINTTKEVLDNKVLVNALTTVHDHVLEGTDISTPMKLSGAFPPMVTYMVGIGEQAGNLEEMLERVAETYDEEVELTTTKLTQLLEPIIIVVLAGVVAGIVIAIILPILQLQNVR